MIYTSPFPKIEIPITPLHEHLFEHADKWAEKPALIDGPTGRSFTYSELRNAITAVAAGLGSRGFKKGDVFENRFFPFGVSHICRQEWKF